jgi:hypothetical protein
MVFAIIAGIIIGVILAFRDERDLGDIIQGIIKKK